QALSVSAMMGNLAQAVDSAKIWHVGLVSCAVFVLTALWRRRREETSHALRAVAAFAITGAAFSYALAAKQMALRYLLPSALCGFLLVALAIHLSRWSQYRWAQIVLLALVAAVLGKAITLDLHVHTTRITQQQSLRDGIANAIQDAAGGRHTPVVVYGF